jgi:hypothetical protein
MCSNGTRKFLFLFDYIILTPPPIPLPCLLLRAVSFQDAVKKNTNIPDKNNLLDTEWFSKYPKYPNKVVKYTFYHLTQKIDK